MISQRDEAEQLGPARAVSTVQWHGWYWLAVAAAVPAGILLTWADAPWWRLLVLYGPPAVMMGVWHTRDTAAVPAAGTVPALIRLSFLASIGAVAAVTAAGDPTGGLSWYTLVALCPAVPCLLSAWLILRRPAAP